MGGDFNAYPVVMTTAQTAELLQINVSSLQKMVRDGRVPAHRFPGGRSIKFLRDEIFAWLYSESTGGWHKAS